MSKNNGSSPAQTLILEDTTGQPQPESVVSVPLSGDGFEVAGRKRITELKSEFEAGQKMLADLATKRNELEATMLRISGAIQVLEELLAKEG